jgi:hypothetical protein
MLDRLALGLVSLPATTYDVVLVLSEVDQTSTPQPLAREVVERIAQSLKPGGRLKSQSGSAFSKSEQTEAILAGLVAEGAEITKPAAAAQTVKLSFGRKKANAAAVPANDIKAAATAKRKSEDISTTQSVKATPSGVGFIDNVDDLGDDYEDDEDEFPSDEALQNAARIDPESLLSEADRQKPLIIREFRHGHAARSHETNPKSSRGLQTKHQAPASVQRLLVWTSPANRSRRQSNSCRSRCKSREAATQRPTSKGQRSHAASR